METQFEPRCFDNILSDRETIEIRRTLLDDFFPWFYSNDKTVVPESFESDADNNTKEFLQFVHQFYLPDGSENSDYCPMVDHILDRFLQYTNFKLKKLYKVKANFQPRVENFLPSQHNTPHTDKAEPHFVLLYYPITSDGNTKIFDRRQNKEWNGQYNIVAEFKPVWGRYVLFDGNNYHAGSHPCLYDHRMVINFNLEFSNELN